MNTSTDSDMFILNDTAKKDAAVQIAMQQYMKQLQVENEYRTKVRAGLVTSTPTTSWNISDRHWFPPMILYAPEDHAAVYTIDSEGTLYFIPKHSDNTLKLEEIAEVDYVDELDEESLKEVHQQLIKMMKVLGYYYQK